MCVHTRERAKEKTSISRSSELSRRRARRERDEGAASSRARYIDIYTRLYIHVYKSVQERRNVRGGSRGHYCFRGSPENERERGEVEKLRRKRRSTFNWFGRGVSPLCIPILAAACLLSRENLAAAREHVYNAAEAISAYTRPRRRAAYVRIR